MENDKTLHLPDLHISGFRGIKSLDVSRLGRVTLIAGKNGVGKTTLLDAIRVYASRGNFNLIAHILSASISGVNSSFPSSLTDTIISSRALNICAIRLKLPREA